MRALPRLLREPFFDRARGEWVYLLAEKTVVYLNEPAMAGSRVPCTISTAIEVRTKTDLVEAGAVRRYGT